ncbi:MAG: penicillin-binding protein activator [Hyphomicrobiaceae bacterium]
MQRPFDRRHFAKALLTGTALAGSGMLLAGCAGGSNGDIGATGAITPGAAGDGPRGRDGTSVKIGLLLPLGAGAQTAAIAKAMQQAAELAIFERANSGLQLVVKDDKGTPEGAKAAAEELVKSGVELIAGPLFSRSVPAVAQIGRAANVPVIAFSNDPAAAVGGAHLLSFLAESEINRAIAYASAQGRTSFAALLPGDAEGKIAEPVLRAAVERHGGRIAFIERYDVDQGGIVEPSRKLKDAFQAAESGGQKIDALFMPGGSDTLPQLSYLLGQAKIDTGRVKLIGTSGWDFPTIGRDARLHGAWFAAPDPRGWRDFSVKFSQTYGHLPPRIASLAFDAVDIASTFANQPKAARFTPQNLTRPSGFTGVDGPVRFMAHGRSERGLAVLEVQKGGPIVVDTPPQTMATVAPLAGAVASRSAAGLN